MLDTVAPLVSRVPPEPSTGMAQMSYSVFTNIVLPSFDHEGEPHGLETSLG